MRTLDTRVITQAVSELAQSTNYTLPEDVVRRIGDCRRKESCGRAGAILGQIEENIRIAGRDQVPLCQDTGFACVFLRIGQQVHLTGGDVNEAVQQGVRDGYEKGYLRKSIVADPLRRQNTGDNTPAMIHVDIVPGDRVEILFAPKGFGSENMSRLAMLPPSAGEQGVRDFVLETVCQADGNPCPPMVIGVGIGGSFDQVALLAKRALFYPLEEHNPDPFYQQMEMELLEQINQTGIGPQGLGGETTALGIHILQAPTHIAGLPVAVNIGCHVSRHGEVIL